MKVEIQDKTLRITLSEDCAIASAQDHLATLRKWLPPPPLSPDAIELNAGAVTTLDTAYLQLLLSLAQTARTAGLTFRLASASPELTRACALYGVQLESLKGEDTHAQNRDDR